MWTFSSVHQICKKQMINCEKVTGLFLPLAGRKSIPVHGGHGVQTGRSLIVRVKYLIALGHKRLAIRISYMRRFLLSELLLTMFYPTLCPVGVFLVSPCPQMYSCFHTSFIPFLRSRERCAAVLQLMLLVTPSGVSHLPRLSCLSLLRSL